LYIWFSICSQKYRWIIKDLYFISGVYSHNLAKSSDGRSPQTKIPKETKKNTDLEPEAYRKSVSNG
jgi:hypothetical protein